MIKNNLKYIVLSFIILFVVDGFAQLTGGDGGTLYFRDKDKDGFGNTNDSKTSTTPLSGYVTIPGDLDDNNIWITNIPPRTFYKDFDGDTFGTSNINVYRSYAPVGYVDRGGDCNDNNIAVHPNTNWYRDKDNDTWGNASAIKQQCIKPNGYVLRAGDHNDDTPNITNIAPKTFYQDSDKDTYGNPYVSVFYSIKPENYVENNLDCNDQDSIITPYTIWYPDGDGDGFGHNQLLIDESVLPPIIQCLQPTGYVNNKDDYHDENEFITDIAPQFFYRDKDQDTFGDSTIKFYRSNPPDDGYFYVLNGDDCDDEDFNEHPNAIWYADGDGDGWGDPNLKRTECIQPINYVLNNKDYDDTTDLITNIAPKYYYDDSDGDTYGDPSISQYVSESPERYVLDNTDRCPDEYGENQGCILIPQEVNFSDENYIYTAQYQIPVTTESEIKYNKDVIESITYYDGLGRAKQQIAIQGSSEHKDIVTHITYDAYGRQDKQYLPFVSNSPAGSYKTVNINSNINSYYLNTYPKDFPGITNPTEVNAYSQSIFESSPLNRVLEQGAPGTVWKVNATTDTDHTIKFGWNTNKIADSIIHFKVRFSNISSTEMPSLIKTGFYGSSELTITITKDENWTPIDGQLHTTEEFKDKQGSVVLKRTFNSAAMGVEKLDTYYVYDDFGNLTYIIPPKVNTSDGVDATELSELCYQYHYDYRNRLIEKKIPGKGWEYIVYNKLDQPILTQDTLLKQKDQWLFTKYDAFGRVAYTGKLTIPTKTRKQIQIEANAFAQHLWVKPAAPALIGGTTLYYNDGGYPKVQSGEVLTINYYDNYDFLGATPVAPFASPASVYEEPISNRTKTLVTGSRVKVLGKDKWTTTVTYYDKKARPIYIASQNEYLATTDVIKNKLDFVGKVLETKTTHTKGDNAAIVTIDTFEYDHMGRLLNHNQQLDGGAIEQIAHNTYDPLGQLQKKYVGGVYDSLQPAKGLQEVDYHYNIRGWLTGINDANSLGSKLFGFGINYNTTETNLGATALYNGNISETLWQTASDQTQRAYGYQYDPLNRITAAKSSSGNYDLSNLTYDSMGNIKTLDRTGHINTDATLFGKMDSLNYRYDTGNKLLAVTDNRNKAFGFKDGSNTGDDYAYDPNGNMISDANKGITKITYNHLNLPDTVTVNSTTHTGNITYIYDATGAKLKKISTDGSSFTTEYAGNYIYENGELKFFNQPEGYIEPSTVSGYDYIYQYKDHLGNIRLSYLDKNADGDIDLIPGSAAHEIREEKHYYPFGMQQQLGVDHPSSAINGTQNKYQTYIGKELNKNLGYNMLEMDWRHYDPAIGRFVAIDAMAESFEDYTPYHYSNNSPIMYKDPTGLFTDVVNEETGEKYHVDDGYDFEWIVSADTFNTITEAGEIPDNLKWDRTKAFWKQVWLGVTTSDGSASDEVTQLMITDDIEDGVEVISQLSNGQYAAAAMGVAMIPLNKLKKLKKLKKWLKKNNGKKIPGTKKGGVTFKNREGNLPKTDANGKPVTYKEYDVNPAPKAGQTRGTERMVTGSDGKTYYTSDHYKTFTEIKD
ncbi:DUF6443 domain-containing protein [Aquimarina sp. W85]|uniref:DUF6443 domain-containing protein n=1 Tax=Aquimarina rhodophyticola TaxID=3342246 RepID=UPI003672C096